jgi:hypothetical protein
MEMEVCEGVIGRRHHPEGGLSQRGDLIDAHAAHGNRSTAGSFEADDARNVAERVQLNVTMRLRTQFDGDGRTMHQPNFESSEINMSGRMWGGSGVLR